MVENYSDYRHPYYRFINIQLKYDYNFVARRHRLQLSRINFDECFETRFPIIDRDYQLINYANLIKGRPTET